MHPHSNTPIFVWDGSSLPPSNFDLSESRGLANCKRISAKLSLPIEGKVDASHENYRILSNAGEQTDEGNEVRANYSSQEPILVYPQHFRRGRRLRRPANPTISVGVDTFDNPHPTSNSVWLGVPDDPQFPTHRRDRRPRLSAHTISVGEGLPSLHFSHLRRGRRPRRPANPPPAFKF